MRSIRKALVSTAVAMSVVSGSVAGASSPPPAYAPAAQPIQDSWLALSMLTPASAVTLGGDDAVAAGQPGGPPPPPPPDQYGNEFPGPPEVIAIWLAVLGLDIYLLTRHHHHHHPNSPA